MKRKKRKASGGRARNSNQKYSTVPSNDAVEVGEVVTIDHVGASAVGLDEDGEEPDYLEVAWLLREKLTDFVEGGEGGPPGLELRSLLSMAASRKIVSVDSKKDAASSSFALAAPSGVSVAAKRASEEQTEQPAVDVSSFGEHFCPDQVGLRKSETEEAGVGIIFGSVHEIAEDEIKSGWPGTDSEDSKKTYYGEKKEHDDLKKKREIFDKTVVLRQAFSDFRKTKEFKVMNNEIKEEVLKRVTRKKSKFEMIVRKTEYTKILRSMFVQKVNMGLKESFSDEAWRKRYLFLEFSNGSAEYQWWEQNFVPETLEKRLDILREAAKKWNSEGDIFLVVELVTEFNLTVHPQTSEKNKVEMFSLAATISSLRSGGDSKI